MIRALLILFVLTIGASTFGAQNEFSKLKSKEKKAVRNVIKEYFGAESTIYMAAKEDFAMCESEWALREVDRIVTSAQWRDSTDTSRALIWVTPYTDYSEFAHLLMRYFSDIETNEKRERGEYRSGNVFCRWWKHGGGLF